MTWTQVNLYGALGAYTSLLLLRFASGVTYLWDNFEMVGLAIDLIFLVPLLPVPFVVKGHDWARWLVGLFSRSDVLRLSSHCRGRGRV